MQNVVIFYTNSLQFSTYSYVSQFLMIVTYMISYMKQWVVFNPDSNKMFRVTKGFYYYL